MTPKQRVIKAINHQMPDRPPIFATLTPQAARKLSDHFGLTWEPPLDSMLSTRISHMELLTFLGNDCVGVAACAPTSCPSNEDEKGIITNEWGMKFKNFGLYNEFCEFPLANAQSVDDIKNYNFPDPYAEGRFKHALTAMAKYSGNYAMVGDLEISVFETSWYLTGLEKFLVDLMLDEPYIFALMDKVMDINVRTGIKLIESGIDIIWAGDDFGSQDGMIMDPATWRKHFKPRIKEMFGEFRRANPDIRIAWHTCGSVEPIIPDFIELGLDILNPVQPLAKDMDPVSLKEKFGNDLVLFGGIDIQNLLPLSTPDQIKKEVGRISRILGKNGGYIAAPAHNIQDDTPIENILAFFEAIKEG